MPKKKTATKKKLSNARPDWDVYFMDMAHMAATRATCDRGVDLKFRKGRKGVGAILVRDKNILASGYNGSPKGMAHCDDAGHEMVDGHCIRTIHAEANAIAQAAKNGVDINGATVYTTASPCYDCFKILINAGIIRVVYGLFYNSRYEMSKKVLGLAKGAKIKMKHISTL